MAFPHHILVFLHRPLFSVRVRPIHELVTPPKPEYEKNCSCVRYLHVVEAVGKYSIGIFVFPPNHRIPLHDHPGMCVLSRILYGTVERSSFNLDRHQSEGNDNYWSTPASSTSSSSSSSSSSLSQTTTPPSTTASILSMFGVGGSQSSSSSRKPASNALQVHRNDNDSLVAPAVTMLFPYEGNLHEFVAGPEGAAVLDVLLPPCDSYGDRDCTFYDVHPGPSDEACWIVPTGQPEDFHCLSGKYLGFGEDCNAGE